MASQSISIDRDHELQTGVDDPVLEQLVVCLLSKALMGRSDRQGFGWSFYLRLVSEFGRAVATVGAKTLPAICPDVPKDLDLPSEQTSRRVLQTDFDSEREAWEAVVARDDAFASISRPRLAVYVPVVLWRVVAAVIAEGPAAYEARIRTVLHILRDQRVKTTARRPTGGHLSQSTLEVYAFAAAALVAPLAKWAGMSDHPGARYLEQWRGESVDVHVPRSREGRGNVTDRGAPPAHLPRRVFSELNAKARERLGAEPGADEVSLIDSLSARRFVGLHRALRNRALFLVLAVVGSRISATCELRQSDFVLDRRRPAPAIGAGPAIRLTPHKTEDGHEPRWKPVPEEVGAVIETYRRYCLRWAGPLSPDAPLFLGGRDQRPYHPNSARSVLSGCPDPRRLALLPIGSDPCIGYSPHSLRYLAKQFVDAPAAVQVLNELGVDPKKQEIIGEVLLDHKVAGMPALYKGDAGKLKQEYYCWAATQITYRMLATELGARRVPDADGYRHWLEREKLLGEQISALKSELRELLEDAERSGREVSPTLILSRTHAVEGLREDLRKAEAAIQAIELGQGTIPLPDDMPDDEVPVVSLAAIRAATLHTPANGGAVRSDRVRNWLTPPEFATLTGYSAASVRDWTATGKPGRSGAWDPDDPPIVRFNTKRRAILVSGLNQDLLFNTFEKRQALEDVLATDPPAGWTGYPLIASG
jgi:integrase